jgi:hypothetical protein
MTNLNKTGRKQKLKNKHEEEEEVIITQKFIINFEQHLKK